MKLMTIYVILNVVLNVKGHPLKRILEERSVEAAALDNASFTKWNENPENKTVYFREDLGLSSHHWHWHYMAMALPPDGTGLRDRKGEMFYYMHRSVVARYDSERLCNGLARVQMFDITTSPDIEEGYFPLASGNSRIAGRQEHALLRDVAILVDDRKYLVVLKDFRKWKERILNAIDAGFVSGEDGQAIELTLNNGLEIIGGLLGVLGMTSANKKFYGDIHNLGHIVISRAHGPENSHNGNVGPMYYILMSVKDPVFYRWHKFIDSFFDKFKQTLPPYTEDELVWQGIQVSDVSVNTPNRLRNLLITNWMESDIDLTRGVHLPKSSTQMNQGEPAWIQNNLEKTVSATVRIFMAPRFNERGQRFPFAQQRSLFFEMDKISTELHPGENKLVRSSEESTVTIPWDSSFHEVKKIHPGENKITQSSEESTVLNPWESSFYELDKLYDAGMYKYEDAMCGCGLPHNLLLPRGNSSGVIFDLFVMVTDGAKDAVPRRNNNRPGCQTSLSFCGATDERYPDSKPMGFPFDRLIRPLPQPGTNTMDEVAEDLEGFFPKNANIMLIQINIRHENTVSLRGNGPPSIMEVLEPSTSNATAKSHRLSV